MALNRKPLRAVTQEDIDTYHRDGVVCLRRKDYPRGFATSWSKLPMQGVNEYKVFKDMKSKEETGQLGKKSS